VPILQLAIKFTEAERALLRKRSVKLDMSEADVLRVCMVMDAMMDGDKDAFKITAGRLREKVGKRLADLVEYRPQDAPVKA
jgi:hypothetical protein